MLESGAVGPWSSGKTLVLFIKSVSDVSPNSSEKWSMVTFRSLHCCALNLSERCSESMASVRPILASIMCSYAMSLCSLSVAWATKYSRKNGLNFRRDRARCLTLIGAQYSSPDSLMLTRLLRCPLEGKGTLGRCHCSLLVETAGGLRWRGYYKRNLKSELAKFWSFWKFLLGFFDAVTR